MSQASEPKKQKTLYQVIFGTYYNLISETFKPINEQTSPEEILEDFYNKKTDLIFSGVIYYFYQYLAKQHYGFRDFVNLEILPPIHTGLAKNISFILLTYGAVKNDIMPKLTFASALCGAVGTVESYSRVIENETSFTNFGNILGITSATSCAGLVIAKNYLFD